MWQWYCQGNNIWQANHLDGVLVNNCEEKIIVSENGCEIMQINLEVD